MTMAKEKSVLFLKIFKFIADAASLYLAFVFSHKIRTAMTVFWDIKEIHPYSYYFIPSLIVVGILMWLIFTGGGYRVKRGINIEDEFTFVLKAVTKGFILFLAITFFDKEADYSRLLLLIYWLTAIIVLTLSRGIINAIHVAFRRAGRDIEKLMVVGSVEDGKKIENILSRHPELGYRIVGVISEEKENPADANVLGSMENIEEVLDRIPVDEVIITLSRSDRLSAMGVCKICEDKGIKYQILSDVFDVILDQSNAGKVEELLFRDIGKINYQNWQLIVKRIIDYVGALLGIVLSSPVWLLTAVAIKVDSRGPVFFKQERVGKHGRKFMIYKFRSMRVDAPKYAEKVSGSEDPRLTKVGAFIRKTSIDELPQLINIFRGEMSFVGPRPEMAFLVEQYDPIYRRRLVMKPGLTGLWQVMGRSDLPLQENIKFDLYYIQNFSLLLDFMIMLRTVPAVIKRKGAY